jgi:predicted nucleotide-binding protein
LVLYLKVYQERTADMGRTSGSKNRNYPPVKLSDALKVASTIEDKASGMTVSRLTLAELLDVSPSSSNFRDLVAASRFYGLTSGGINSEEFGLAQIGQEATGGDEVARVTALKKAVLGVPVYKAFFEAFANKKVPGTVALREFLTKTANVAAERTDECISFILADAETAGLQRTVKGTTYIDLSGAAPPKALGETTPVDPGAEDSDSDDEREEAAQDTDSESRRSGKGAPISHEKTAAQPGTNVRPKKVFIAHGKNRAPLEQLKKALDQFKVSYAVAVDEPNKGRPISRKVATLMQEECSSGIFIFTADEQFQRTVDGKPEEVWRPSENVVFELGAASILYENRIVIFKEKGVTFPSDFSDLGYIEFEKDRLVAELGSLFSELVGLDILEVRAKG